MGLSWKDLLWKTWVVRCWFSISHLTSLSFQRMSFRFNWTWQMDKKKKIIIKRILILWIETIPPTGCDYVSRNTEIISQPALVEWKSHDSTRRRYSLCHQRDCVMCRIFKIHITVLLCWHEHEFLRFSFS